MSHVFISYSKKNRSYARKLADYLLASGFDVWIDDRIDFGSNWEREIFKAVDACAAIIVIMTPESYDSLWVQRERQYAENRRKQPLPLLLDGEAFPFYVVVQHYDVRGGKLPDSAFLEQLAEFVPHHSTAGQDVAAVPQQEARLKFETAEAAKVEPETAVPRQAVADPVRRSRSWIVFAAAALVIALTAGLLAAMNGQNVGGLAAPTPAPTLFGGGQGEIAFVSDRDGNEGIYLINVDGSNPRRLTDTPEGDTEPAWSPDGEQIVFTSYRVDGDSKPFIMDADGGNARRLIEELSGWDPAWSPDGTQIAFTSYGNSSPEIFVAGADGRDLRMLTSNDFWDGYAAWSPDGTRIVFASGQDGQDDLYIIDSDGENRRNLTNDPTEDLAPSWSPDGMWIAFQSTPEEYPQICMIRPDGSDLHCIPSDAGDASDPVWSPDGTQILFSSYRDSNFGKELYIIGADGTGIRRLTTDPAEDRLPAWRP